MADRARQRNRVRLAARFAVPALLAVSLWLGGASAPGMMVHQWLQLLGLAVILVCVWKRDLFAVPDQARPFIWLAFAWIGLLLIQLIPLPAGLRKVLPGGETIARGYEAIGLEMPATALSLAPAETATALLMVITPLSIFLLVSRLSWRTNTMITVWAIPFLGVMSVLLGLMQLAGGSESATYFYDVTNSNYPVGTFANINHQAVYLLMVLPILGFLAGEARVGWGRGQREPARLVVLGGASALIILGIVMAGSMAGYALLLPTLMLAATLVFGRRRLFGKIRFRVALPIVFLIGLGVSFWLVAPFLDAVGMEVTASDDMSRRVIWLTSLGLLRDYWVVGAGVGSFPDLYALYEQPTDLTNIYANHAHNDYLEWIIEMGLLGTLIFAAFVAMAIRVTIQVWRLEKSSASRLKRAASIAFWLPFFHSFVEFPLRTPALAAFVAMCLAIMIVPAERSVRARREAEAEKSQRLSRRVEI